MFDSTSNCVNARLVPIGVQTSCRWNGLKLLYKYACIAELHCRLVEPLSGTILPPYLLLFFDQRQICDVRANLNSKRDRQVDNKLGKNAN